MRNILVGRIAAAAIMLATAPAAGAMTVLGVYNTGVDASGTALASGSGVTDPHYHIVGGTASEVVIGAAAKTFPEFDWFMPDTTHARAINASGTTQASDNSDLTFETTFDLTGFTTASAHLHGTVQADDSARVTLNGHDLGIDAGYDSPVSFDAVNPAWFVAGTNLLDFTLHNNGGHTALRVDNLSLTADAAGVVPEPTTWALLAGGFGLVGAARRRRSLAMAA